MNDGQGCQVLSNTYHSLCPMLLSESHTSSFTDSAPLSDLRTNSYGGLHA